MAGYSLHLPISAHGMIHYLKIGQVILNFLRAELSESRSNRALYAFVSK
jgi:hypothetical protein